MSVPPSAGSMGNLVSWFPLEVSNVSSLGLYPDRVALEWPTAAATRALGWTGALVPDVPLLGQMVTVVAKIEGAEHDRRARLQTGAIVDYAMLDHLANLPYQTPVPVRDDRWSARATALGVVEAAGGNHRVTRVARRPCHVIGVLRCGDQWLRSIQQISLFAPLATRAVVLPCRARDGGAAEMEAASLGVGLVRYSEAGMTVEVPPDTAVSRLSTGHWLMGEAVYSAWLATAADRSG